MSGRETEDAELLRALVESFTKDADAIEIETTVETRRPVETLRLRVSGLDQAKVVGGQGRQIQALRTIFQFIAARESRTIRVILLEPEGGRHVEPRMSRETDELTRELAERDDAAPYDAERVRELAERVLSRVLVKPFAVDIYGADGTQMMEIAASKSEHELAEALVPYVRSVFNAVGRHHGQELHVELKPVIPVPETTA